MSHKSPLKRLGAAFKYALLLAVAAVLLYASFRGVVWEDFKAAILTTDFRWISLSMFAGIVAFWIRALRWRLIMLPLGYKVKRRDAWDGINIGYLTNFAIPRAGELARCGVITKSSGIPFEKVAGTVVLERSTDLLSLAIISLSVVLLEWRKFGNFISREIITAIENRFYSGFFWITGAFLLSFAVFLYIVYRLRKRHKFFRKISDIVKGVFAGVASGFSMPRKWLFFLYTLLIWTLYWLMSYTTILAFPAVGGLTPVDALFLMIVGGFGWVVPVQGGIGAYHFIISLALASVYSVGQTTGIAFAAISHESQAVTMIVCGGISFITLSLSKRKG
ncbi:MAG: lysylphosphatidylglycerol synthase transmembrane domain-containing protein [Bacteroidales bacterium]|nr:lysylphosphatidylglycerol synthase transmembrane domain-containing protein [Bacteroidales bacterium]